DLLAEALVTGEAVHPDSGRLRRALTQLDELWRRSGGTLGQLAPEALLARVRAQLEPVTGWDEFQRTRILVEPEELVHAETRARLDALPGMMKIRGDAVPIDYEVAGGEGVARIRLREGQARRLRPDEVPALDRPVRFAVQRGRHAPLLSDTVTELQSLLRRTPRAGEDDPAGGRPHRPGGHRRRQGHRGPGRRPRR
ncbi:MAG TPA: hypothetical protein VJ277_10140, partial [Gemmatimonadales bacterium]|nr:hypothetical protein [Gemmatimonadales bacterium]